MEIPLSKDKDGYTLKVIVKTGARTAGIEGIEGDVLKLKIKSQPHDGLANKELVEMLSEILNVPKSKVEIIKGKTSKHKVIKIKEN
ncbi:MAG: DUF167 domain-containing protein [Thermodesulfovibrio sp.]|jgi:uncharacterized protein (TIGR00251 family)|uniref:UPF0235 protein C0186_05265 n=2 Tax=Thermodesulfovibrio TaxID=28261 RepID=A0A2J6WIK9_9BACT|nr:MAG: YggU family protein [Thermodesulfovibrio aggregans]